MKTGDTGKNQTFMLPFLSEPHIKVTTEIERTAGSTLLAVALASVSLAVIKYSVEAHPFIWSLRREWKMGVPVSVKIHVSGFTSHVMLHSQVDKEHCLHCGRTQPPMKYLKEALHYLPPVKGMSHDSICKREITIS